MRRRGKRDPGERPTPLAEVGVPSVIGAEDRGVWGNGGGGRFELTMIMMLVSHLPNPLHDPNDPLGALTTLDRGTLQDVHFSLTKEEIIEIGWSTHTWLHRGHKGCVGIQLVDCRAPENRCTGEGVRENLNTPKTYSVWGRGGHTRRCLTVGNSDRRGLQTGSHW